MDDLFENLPEPICEDTANVIFSAEFSDGHSLFGSLDGPTSEFVGPAPVPANRSRQRGSGKAKPTKDTSGRCSFGSSASAALSAFLVNRLQAMMDLDGSPEFVMTWKRKAMQSGAPIYRLHASPRRTGATVCSSWPTPNCNERGKEMSKAHRENSGGLDLQSVAALASWPASWPTPTAQDNDQIAGEYANPNSGTTLGGAARLAAWATPRVADTLSAQAGQDLSGWPTPTVSMMTEQDLAQALTAGNSKDRQTYADSGIIIESSPAETEKPGESPAKRPVLNPFFSAWLMGLPVAWTIAGLSSMHLPVSRSRKASVADPLCSEESETR